MEEVAQRAGVTVETPRRLGYRRLSAYGDVILAWVHGRLVRICRDRKIQPTFVLLPMAAGKSGNQPTPREVQVAADAGFTVFNLQGVYDEVDEHSLWIAEWDAHPNALGHRLVAERMIALIRQSQPKIPSDL